MGSECLGGAGTNQVLPVKPVHCTGSGSCPERTIGSQGAEPHVWLMQWGWDGLVLRNSLKSLDFFPNFATWFPWLEEKNCCWKSHGSVQMKIPRITWEGCRKARENQPQRLGFNQLLPLGALPRQLGQLGKAESMAAVGHARVCVWEGRALLPTASAPRGALLGKTHLLWLHVGPEDSGPLC